MIEYAWNKIDDKKEWENLTAQFGVKTFLQSWNWGATNQKQGYQVFRWCFKQAQETVGIVQFFLRHSRRGTHLAIPGGPYLASQEVGLLDYFCSQIIKLAQARGAWFIRMRPDLINAPENGAIWQKRGFRPAPMPMHAENTLQLDLRPSPDELIKKMRKGTRYEIRRAEKIGIIVRQVGEDKLDELYRMQYETGVRAPFTSAFLHQLFSAFAPDKEVLLIEASSQGKSAAMALILLYQQVAFYYVGASRRQLRKLPASHLLLWKAILQAKDLGCHTFNFWGVAPPLATQHAYEGLTFFKLGFGGERVDYLPAHDLCLDPRYYLTYIFERFQRWQRNL